MRYINFHCHRFKQASENIQVVSINVDEAIYEGIPGNCTVGIHPWQCEHKDVEAWINQLESVCKNPNVIAIGEIGLDRLRGGGLEMQSKILLAQAEIAQRTNKPIVIHCVRAWGELIKALSDAELLSVKKAIHGFRGKAELAIQLVNLNYYLSFGSILVDPTPELAEALTVVPLNRLFFETDISEMPIDEVYAAASDILDIPVEELGQQLEKNFSEFFRT